MEKHTSDIHINQPLDLNLLCDFLCEDDCPDGEVEFIYPEAHDEPFDEPRFSYQNKPFDDVWDRSQKRGNRFTNKSNYDSR